MNRVINELSSDEVQRGTGMKVGDFGTGGRTYVKHYTREQGSGKGNNKCVFFVLVLLGVGLLAYVETDLLATSQSLEQASKEAFPLRRPVLTDDKLLGRLIHVTSYDPELIGVPPSDPMFSISSGNNAPLLKRNTEYCQWQETEHVREIKEGEERGADGKVRDKIRREKTYTYYKTWRSHRISSLMFDNPAAYHNPQRDPAPAQQFAAEGGIDLASLKEGKNGLKIAATDFENALESWEQVYLAKQDTQLLSNKALQEGFAEADHQYFYSRVPKDGFMGNPVVKAAASYLVDGVIDVNNIASATGVESLLGKAGLDWITKGSCNAGDVRVSFQKRRLPKVASVIAQVGANNKLSAYTYSNGVSRVYATQGALDLETMVKKLHSDARWYANLYRAGIALLILIAAFFGAEFYSGGNALPLFAFVASAALGAIWLYCYGPKNAVLGICAVAAASGAFVFTLARGSSSSGSKPQQAAASGTDAKPPPQQDNKAAYNAEKQSAPLPTN